MSFSDIGITSFVEKKENLSMLKPFKYLKAKEFFHIKFSSKELFELEHLSSKQEFYYLVLKGVVEQHRGVISSVDKEINIYFPISESASLQTNVNEPVKLKRKIQNILYAEDQDDIRETTSELLRLNNYNVFEYENGLLALENFKNKNCDIDLVITDFSMPKLNGSDLFKQVRSVNQNIPCIFTSGYSQSEITKGGNLPPGTRYLKKPYDFKTLISVIEDIYSL